MNIAALESIGLSPGEIRVYLALLEIGSATVSPLAKRAHVTASKVYPVTDRLIEKGLISTIIKDGVKQFSVTSPSRIKEYMLRKEQELQQQQRAIEALLPQLEAKRKMLQHDMQAEVLVGWKGMETAYDEMLDTLQSGECDYVLGAAEGRNTDRTYRFYDAVLAKAKRKGIKFKVISQERLRERIEQQSKGAHMEGRYLDHATHTETNIYKDTVFIVIHTEEPTVIKIRSADVAASYLEYFNSIWSIAKK